jgi:tetratricopeptide (TPR) repeat protein
MKKIKSVFVMCLLSSIYTMAQVTPSPSPNASFTQMVGLTKISVEYSRPGVKGREIFGKLIPYGKVWRTGANQSTKFETSTDVMVEGQKLAAGKYSVMSFPETGEWTIVFSKNLGVQEATYKEADDALRVKVKTQEHGMTESFTISTSDIKADAATLNIYWEKVKVALSLGVETDKNVEAAIAKQQNDAASALQSGADYLSTKNPEKALELINKSMALKETFRNSWTKAQIMDKMGKPAEALELAQKAQTLGANDPVYQFFKDGIEKGITDMKAKIPAIVPAVQDAIKGKKKKN